MRRSFWLVSVLFGSAAWATDSGVLAPKAVSQLDPGLPSVFWTQIDEALLQDGMGASATLTETDQSTMTLSLSDFGFSLPEESNILGLEASIYVAADNLSGSAPFLLQSKFTKAGGFSVGFVDPAVMDPTDGSTFGPTEIKVGGASELFGSTLSAAEVSDPGFAFEIRWEKAGPPDISGTIHVDFVTITIWFEGPSGETGVISASRPGPYFEGESLTLTSPAGDGFQWTKDGNFIPGATDALLDFSPLAIEQSGSYGVLFSTITKELAAAPPFELEVLPAEAGEPDPPIVESMPATRAALLLFVSIGVVLLARNRLLVK